MSFALKVSKRVTSKLIVNFNFNCPYHDTTNIEFQFKLVFIEIKPVQCKLKTKKKNKNVQAKINGL